MLDGIQIFIRGLHKPYLLFLKPSHKRQQASVILKQALGSPVAVLLFSELRYAQRCHNDLVLSFGLWDGVGFSDASTIHDDAPFHES